MFKEIIFTVILGIVQGVTELLPISSSAHVALTEQVLGFHLTLSQEAILNAGSFLAILFYFRKDIIGYFKNGNDLILKIGLSSIPVLFFAFIFKDFLSELKSNFHLIAYALIGVGILMIVVENKFKGMKDIYNSTKFDFLTLSFMQVFSLIRGVSRSGILIISGTVLGFNPENTVKIAFLMSVPVMFVISVFGIYSELENLREMNIVLTLIGFIVTFISSYYTIEFLIKFISKNSFIPFAIYRIILGVIILILL